MSESPNAVIADIFKFAFLADTHVKDSLDADHSMVSIKIRNTINNSSNVNENSGGQPYSWVAIAGDMTNQAFTYEDHRYMDIWGNGKPENHVYVCDGVGNHDLFNNFSQRADTLGRILKPQNNFRSKHPDFIVSKDGYNYRWKKEISFGVRKVNLHFFMLNMYPGYGGKKSHDKNPLDSLTFLKSEIAKTPEIDPIFLIHHFDFDLSSTTGNWTDAERKEYLAVVERHNIVAILCGHQHTFRSYKLGEYVKGLSGKMDRLPVIVGGGVTSGDMRKGAYLSCTVTMKKRDDGQQCNGKLIVELMECGADNMEKPETTGKYTKQEFAFEAIARKPLLKEGERT